LDCFRLEILQNFDQRNVKRQRERETILQIYRKLQSISQKTEEMIEKEAHETQRKTSEMLRNPIRKEITRTKRYYNVLSLVPYKSLIMRQVTFSAEFD